MELLLGPRSRSCCWSAEPAPHDTDEDVVIIWNLSIDEVLSISSQARVSVGFPSDKFKTCTEISAPSDVQLSNYFFESIPLGLQIGGGRYQKLRKGWGNLFLCSVKTRHPVTGLRPARGGGLFFG
jgi:hypothetical protein